MRILSFVLVILMFFSGCANTAKVEEYTFDIVTSFYPIYVFTQNIVKDVPNVKVTNMSREHHGCLHNYQLTTADMKLIDSADVFIINGAGLEGFVEKVYNSKEDLEVIDSSKNIKLLTSEYLEEENPHIWLSISNAINQVNNITEELIKIDEKNSEKYLKNSEEYIKKLENLRNKLREEMYVKDDIKIVTSHDAFPYFAEDFGIDIISVIEKNEGTSPTSKEMRDIIDLVKNNDVNGIFIEKDSSHKIANTISEESGVKVFELDTITSGNGNIDDYEVRMENNIKVIKGSL